MDSFGRWVRTVCPECGSDDIIWGRLIDIAFAMTDLVLRKRAFELSGFLGMKSEGWRCGCCNFFGAFGPTEFGISI